MAGTVIIRRLLRFSFFQRARLAAGRRRLARAKQAWVSARC